MISNNFERVANARYNERTTSELINHWHPWNVFDCRRFVEKPWHEKVHKIHLRSRMPSELVWKMVAATRRRRKSGRERYKRKPREKTRSRWRKISPRSYGILPRRQYARGIYKLSRTVKIYSVTCPRTSSLRLEPVAGKLNRLGWVVP